MALLMLMLLLSIVLSNHQHYDDVVHASPCCFLLEGTCNSHSRSTSNWSHSMSILCLFGHVHNHYLHWREKNLSIFSFVFLFRHWHPKYNVLSTQHNTKHHITSHHITKTRLNTSEMRHHTLVMTPHSTSHDNRLATPHCTLQPIATSFHVLLCCWSSVLTPQWQTPSVWLCCLFIWLFNLFFLLLFLSLSSFWHCFCFDGMHTYSHTHTDISKCIHTRIRTSKQCSRLQRHWIAEPLLMFFVHIWDCLSCVCICVYMCFI